MTQTTPYTLRVVYRGGDIPGEFVNIVEHYIDEAGDGYAAGADGSVYRFPDAVSLRVVTLADEVAALRSTNEYLRQSLREERRSHEESRAKLRVASWSDAARGKRRWWR